MELAADWRRVILWPSQKQASSLTLKGPYADHILIPQGQLEVVYCLTSNESPYFSDCKPEMSASNSL